MRGFVRLVVIGSLAFILTEMAAAINAVNASPGAAAVVALALPGAGLFLASLFLRQVGDHEKNRRAFLELLVLLAIMYLPDFLALGWLNHAPSDLSQYGPKQFVVILVVLFAFELALFLEESDIVLTLRVALVIYTISIVLDFFTGGLIFQNRGGRAAGFLANANDGADTVAALMLVSLPWRERNAIGYVLIIIGFIGCGLTLSRGGLALWGLVSIAYIGLTLMGGRASAKITAMVTAGVAGVGVTVFIRSPELLIPLLGLSTGTTNRLASIASFAQGDLSSANNDGRGTMVAEWFDVVQREPFLGGGTNYSWEQIGPTWGYQHYGPHNTYLARMADCGLIGIMSLVGFIFLWCVYFWTRRLVEGVIFTLAFAYTCMLSHNVVGMRSMISVFAVLAVVALRREQASLGERRHDMARTIGAKNPRSGLTIDRNH